MATFWHHRIRINNAFLTLASRIGIALLPADAIAIPSRCAGVTLPDFAQDLIVTVLYMRLLHFPRTRLPDEYVKVAVTQQKNQSLPVFEYSLQVRPIPGLHLAAKDYNPKPTYLIVRVISNLLKIV